jgi:hypothetical protein
VEAAHRFPVRQLRNAGQRAIAAVASRDPSLTTTIPHQCEKDARDIGY